MEWCNRWTKTGFLAKIMRTLPTGIHNANSQVSWRRNNGLGLDINLNNVQRHFRQSYTSTFREGPVSVLVWRWGPYCKYTLWWLWRAKCPVACTRPRQSDRTPVGRWLRAFSSLFTAWPRECSSDWLHTRNVGNHRHAGRKLLEQAHMSGTVRRPHTWYLMYRVHT